MCPKPKRRKEDGSNSFKAIDLDLAHYVAGDKRIEYYRNQNNVYFFARQIGNTIKVGVVDVEEVEEFVLKHCPENYLNIFRPSEGGSQDVRLTLTEQERTILNYMCVKGKKRKKELLEQHLRVWLESESKNILVEKNIDLTL